MSGGYTNEYRGAALSIKYSIPKKITITFYNGSNHDYHLIIKELAEEFKGQFDCLGENTEKYINVLVLIEKEGIRINKMEKKLQKQYFTDYSLLTAQDLWEAHYQILLIILMKDFIKSNVNTDMIIKNVKSVELSIKIVSPVLIHKH